MKDAIARERIKAAAAVQTERDRRYSEVSLERDRRYTERFAAQEQANAIALAAANERLARMNEFRDQLTDQAGTFVTRDTLSAELKGIESTMGRLETAAADQRGRGAGIGSIISYAIAALGVLAAVSAVIFK